MIVQVKISQINVTLVHVFFCLIPNHHNITPNVTILTIPIIFFFTSIN